jgi:hypothetical protein
VNIEVALECAALLIQQCDIGPKIKEKKIKLSLFLSTTLLRYGDAALHMLKLGTIWKGRA